MPVRATDEHPLVHLAHGDEGGQRKFLDGCQVDAVVDDLTTFFVAPPLHSHLAIEVRLPHHSVGHVIQGPDRLVLDVELAGLRPQAVKALHDPLRKFCVLGGLDEDERDVCALAVSKDDVMTLLNQCLRKPVRERVRACGGEQVDIVEMYTHVTIAS